MNRLVARYKGSSEHSGEMVRDRSGQNRKRSDDLPRVLRCLFEEHRHLSSLVNVLESRIKKDGNLGTADYYLMRDIVGYMHDYPDQVHHPTENRLFALLLKRKPSRKASVERLLGDHKAVEKETRKLLSLLDEVIAEPDDLKKRAVRLSCQAFIRHQRAHMQFENREMFPAAIESLTPADWRHIEKHFEKVDDPLFGQTVDHQHRLLYEYLLSPVNQVSEKISMSRLFSLDHLLRTVDIMEKGQSEWWQRVGELGMDVGSETLEVMVKAVKPKSLGSAIGLPLNYAAFLGKSLFDCSSDLVRISSTTAKDALGLFSESHPDK